MNYTHIRQAAVWGPGGTVESLTARQQGETQGGESPDFYATKQTAAGPRGLA